MRPKVSILVGSGFSVPEGLPGVRQLNQRLSKIDESEILIHTDQRAIFLNGQDDPNRLSSQDKRLFLQEFLEFYSTEVLKPNEEFHYETFYDYYSGYLTKQGQAKYKGEAGISYTNGLTEIDFERMIEMAGLEVLDLPGS